MEQMLMVQTASNAKSNIVVLKSLYMMTMERHGKLS